MTHFARLVWAWCWRVRFHLISKSKAIRLGSVGKDCMIYPSARIYHGRQVALGDRVTINDFVHIWGGGGVAIGDDSMIASHCAIVSQSHDADALGKKQKYRDTQIIRGPIVIGKNAWIGASAVILPGIHIGDNAIVGAGAVVTKNVPANTVVAGTPASVIRRL